ncbi:hypothetical protein ACO0LD_12490 [Undibacterium sp. Ji83W]|uniref:hypothetical protein n=1 Tax=Undibacterium sp. Ji83W TaxID=3413043 RepID=UPI003BF44F0E
MDTTIAMDTEARSVRSARHFGLIPDQDGLQKNDARSWLKYFFVEYNPLYFISAFCMLYGIFLIDRNLATMTILSGPFSAVGLLLVLQLYELSLLAAAMFLAHRLGAIRPAAMLCLLECVLLFDCTFRLEGLAMQSWFGVAIDVLWLLMLALKLRLMAVAMRLDIKAYHYVSVLLTAACIPLLIAFLSRVDSNHAVGLQVAAWLGTLIVLALELRRPPLRSGWARNEDQARLADSCIKAAFRIFIGFYFYHVWAFLFFVAEPSIRVQAVFGQFSAYFLLCVLTRTAASDIWKFAILMLINSFFTPVVLTHVLILLSVAMGLQAWHRSDGNLGVAASLLMFAATCLSGWSGDGASIPDLPAWYSWKFGVLAICLLLISYRTRSLLAIGLLSGAACYALYQAVGPLLPHKEIGKGAVVIALAFLMLLTGLWVNMHFRVHTGDEEA